MITVVPITPNIDLSDGSEIMTAVPGAVSPTGLSEVDSLNLLHYNLTIPAIFLEPGYDSIVDSTLTIEGNLENYGSINISQDSTAKIMGRLIGTTEGQPSGTGTISVQSQSTFAVQGAATATNETISLTSGHLYIGDGGALADPGRQFLAPITMYSASTVTLEDTKATSEVFWKQTGQLVDRI